MLALRRTVAERDATIVRMEHERRNYTQAVTEALLESASVSASTGYVAALEIAAGQMSRAFAAAEPVGRSAVMFPADTLADVGRSLVEAGEAVWFTRAGTLARAETYDIDPSGRYRITVRGAEFMLPPERVLHARWNADPATGRGISPLSNARTLRTLMQRLEDALATESSAAVGYLLPIPTDGGGQGAAQLRNDLASLQGRIAVVETTRGGWGEGSAGAPRRDFELVRMGPDYPQSSVDLYHAARNTVLAACGYPVQLVLGSDGTGQREAWRRYLHGTVAPLGAIFERAAARAGIGVSLRWDRLFASDIQGRARAFQSMVNGGMDIARAAAVSGLIVPEAE